VTHPYKLDPNKLISVPMNEFESDFVQVCIAYAFAAALGDIKHQFLLLDQLRKCLEWDQRNNTEMALAVAERHRALSVAVGWDKP
jgi:hypothetical protein